MKKNSLLYVEDDLGSRQVMQGLVERLTMPVYLTIFEDSNQFIERTEKISPKPDIFLLDIHVKPLDGFDMLRLLREHDDFSSKMVIALTASVMNEEVNKLKKAGFDGVLAKPLSFHRFPQLMDRIQSGERLWTVIR